MTLKAPYSSKIDIFFIQERFNNLIYSINTIIKCGIWEPVKFQLVSCLLLATLIQRHDKNHFILRTRDLLKFYRQSGATCYDCINTIYQFIKPFLDIKMSVFEVYGAFNGWLGHKTSTQNQSYYIEPFIISIPLSQYDYLCWKKC